MTDNAAIAARLRAQAAEILRTADEIESGATSRPSVVWIGTGEAARITQTSPSTVRRWAEKYGCGYMTARNVWLYDKAKILEIALGEARCDADNSFGDANDANLHISKVSLVY